MMDNFVIPIDKLQATIHLQGREAALTELLATIDDNNFVSMAQVRGEIINMKDEIKEILE